MTTGAGGSEFVPICYVTVMCRAACQTPLTLPPRAAKTGRLGRVRSIELTFHHDDDLAVRSAWDALVAADLPSMGRHDAPSNRPHVTLAAGVDLPVPEALPTPPATIRIGGVLLFPAGSDRVVLARAVVVDEALATFHLAVHEGEPAAVPTTQPGRWSPHVTLARRIRTSDLSAALDVLAATPLPDTLTIEGVRHWAGDTTTVTPLTTR